MTDDDARTHDEPPRVSGQQSSLRVVVVLLLLAFVPTLHRYANGFVWDDITTIARGETLHHLRSIPSLFTHRTMFVSQGAADEAITPVDTYRPVTLTTFVIDSQFSGRRPWAYHTTNLLLHAAATLLLWRTLRHLVGKGAEALAPWGAAFFALSPQLAEGHVWINGRSDPLCTVFGLAALLCALRSWTAPSPRPRWLVAAGALFLLGLGSKEVLVGVLPALFFWPDQRTLRERATRMTPFFIATACYFAVRITVLGGVRASYGAAQTRYSLARLAVLWFDAMRELLMPMHVHLRMMLETYGRISALWLALAWLGAAGLLVLAFALRARLPQLRFALLWFAGPLAPVAVIASIDWMGFGRYLYLPAVGVAALLVSLAAAARVYVPQRSVVLVRLLVGAYFVLLAVKLAAWTADFRSEDTLYGAAMQDAPETSVGYGYLGLLYFERDDCARGLPLLLRAREITPVAQRYWGPLGRCALRLGDLREAARTAQAGSRRFPTDPQVRVLVQEFRQRVQRPSGAR
ncbi:MAG: hypothetical protein Q8Q09_20865 [Deltaproteobacteria bacterium]|nr:hypothetical protein [Deltaproteobacteria bacterium]